MYCSNCRASVNENAKFCVNCGINIKQTVSIDDKPNIWINLISLFYVPILGIIVYFIWRKNRPRAAKSALMFGLLNIAITVILGAIYLYFWYRYQK